MHKQMAKIFEDGKTVFDLEATLQLEIRAEIPSSGHSVQSDESDHFEYFRPLIFLFPKTTAAQNAEKTGVDIPQSKGSYHRALIPAKS